MVIRRNLDDDVSYFEAMINVAVANALPNLTAALRTQITNDIRNGAESSGGSGGETEKLYAKFFKRAVLVTASRFLGHIVSADGIIMDPSKVEAITKWPRPTTVTELMRKGEKLCGRFSYERQGGELNLMLRSKKLKGTAVELWAIVQNVEDGKHTEFSVDDDGVVWFEDRLCVLMIRHFARRIGRYVEGLCFGMGRLFGLEYLCLVEFAYNNCWHMLASMQHLSWLLYVENVGAPICWDEVVRDRIFMADKHRHDLEFYGGDRVLSEEVAYRLALPPQLLHVHDVFSMISFVGIPIIHPFACRILSLLISSAADMSLSEAPESI
ncbi:hypothetical protein Tco_0134010 [Tanacetum coccineum]